MSSPLENLCGPNQPLKLEPPDVQEFEGLRRSGLERLADARREANSLSGRFDLAYTLRMLFALRRCVTPVTGPVTGTSDPSYTIGGKSTGEPGPDPIIPLIWRTH